MGKKIRKPLLVLAYAYFGLNDLGRAREEARKISNTNANAALLLGAIDYINGNDTSAIQNANLAATLDRRNLGGYALSIVGLSYIATGSPEREARTNINEAISLSREDAFVYLASSCLNYKINRDNPRAIADFNNADRLSAQRPEDTFLAVLSPRLQEHAIITCLLPEVATRPIRATSTSTRYKFIESINLGASVTALAVSCDSNFVAVGLNNGRVVIYNLQTKREVASFNLSQSNAPINSVTFSPNGKDIAFASSDGQLRVFKIEGRNEKYSLPNIGDSPQIIFSNNNNFLFVGNGTGRLRIINNNNSETILVTSNVYPGGVTSLILNLDNPLVSGGDDGRIRVWNPNDITPLNSYLAHQGAVIAMAFSADGSQIVSIGTDNLVNACNWRTGVCAEVARTNETIGSLAVASNGDIAFSERPFLIRPENRIFLQDLNTRQVLGTLPDHRDRVVALAYTPDSRFLISGSADQTIIIWEVQ
ncbi:MAG: hypothetical protein HC916_21905 [Coleofasciculaceae cyanobacterium SM2_1_6]|nr:hypothetical protein [Coleofasciculaceae cyanobacterium SM2_1_6]